MVRHRQKIARWAEPAATPAPFCWVDDAEWRCTHNYWLVRKKFEGCVCVTVSFVNVALHFGCNLRDVKRAPSKQCRLNDDCSGKTRRRSGKRTCSDLKSKRAGTEIDAF